MFSPDLETRRLTLHSIGPEHQAFVREHFGHPDVTRYLVDEAPVETEAEAREIVEFYADPDRLRRNRWVLTLKDSGEPIGTVGFHLHDAQNRKIEVGYDLGPEHWGHGYMSEALAAALDHAFSNLEVFRVEAYVHVDNGRSGALLTRLGFQLEGTIRAKHVFEGVWHDHHLFSLLATDPRPDGDNRS